MPNEAKNRPPTVPGYSFRQLIGSGSYGEVWLALDALGVWRAIKVVHRNRFSSDRPYEREYDGIQRFEPVSRSQPSQVSILGVGRRDDEGWFYYVMELADDQRTAQRIDPDKYAPRTLGSDLEARGHLPLQEVVELGVALCVSLEHLHTHGLVHRDIKPSNIVFVHGLPKLADIGLVAGLDETMSFVGTEGFVPPEGPGSEKADLYSLGKVLYQLHTGRSQTEFPFLPTAASSGDDAVLAQDLNLVMLKACAPDPAKRHASVAELRYELQLLQAGRSIRRLRATEQRAQLFARFVVVAIVVAALALGAWAITFKSRQDALAAKSEAEKQAGARQEALWQALLEKARALRMSSHPGRKSEGLRAIADAARIRSTPELVNEAIAHLALWDLEWDRDLGPYRGRRGDRFDLHPAGDWIASWQQGQGVLRTVDGRRHREFSSQRKDAEGAFSLDGRFFLWRDGAGAEQLCSLADLTVAERQGVAGKLPTFSPDGGFYAVRCNDRKLAVASTAAGSLLAEIVQPENSKDIWCDQFAFEPLANDLVVGRNSGKGSYHVEKWNWRENRRVAEISVPWNLRALAAHGPATAIGNDVGHCIINFANQPSVYVESHHDRLEQMIFSRDGEQLFTTAYGDPMRIYASYSGRLLLEVPGISAFATSPDGTRFVGHDASHASLWRVRSSVVHRTFRCPIGDSRELVRVNFSADNHAMLAYLPQKVWVFNPASGEPLGELASGSGTIKSVFFTTDSRVAILDATAITFWPWQIETENGRERIVWGKSQSYPLPETVTWFCWPSTNTRQIGMPLDSRRIGILDVANPGAMKRFSSPENPADVMLNHDGSLVVSRNHNGTAPIIWDVKNGKLLARLAEDNATCWFSPDGSLLLAAGSAAHRIYDTATWTIRHEIPTRATSDRPSYGAWSPDGSMLAVNIERSRIILFETRTWKQLAELTSPDPLQGLNFCFSPDGHYLAVGSLRSRVELWDLEAIQEGVRKLGLTFAWSAPAH